MKPRVLIPTLIISLAIFAGCGSDSASPPEITTVNPTVGNAGTEVSIAGTGFSSDTTNITVSFNGTSAKITSASDNKLTVIVPEGAATGVISVQSGGQTVVGPSFTVDERLSYKGDYESQNYDTRVLSERADTVVIDTTVSLSYSSDVEVKSVNGSSNEIEIGLEDFIQRCFVETENAIDGSSTGTLNFIDDPIASVNGMAFKLDKIGIEFHLGSDTLLGRLTGAGTLDSDGNITLNFEFYIQGSGGKVTFSGEDVELERQ